MTTDVKTLKRARRHKRIRASLRGTAERPRLAVFRSNTQIYAQLINDDAGTTLAAASSLGDAYKNKKAMEKAELVGAEIAKKAKELKVSAVVFDRAGFVYAGKIKAIAEAARQGGLTF